MCQTLFYIPDQLLGLPVFGLGWLLFVWGVVSVAWIGSRYRTFGWSDETKEPIPFLLFGALLISFVLPRLEVRTEQGITLGLPIRGYGTLMLIGVVAGWWLSAWRATRRGLSVDLIAALGFWIFFAGIIGARVFFVIEYWHEFQKPTLVGTLKEIFSVTEGGLVVYGSLIGGFPAFVAFARRHSLSVFALGDLIVPGVVLGMAIGRLGCLMNGCCYGGLSEHGAIGIRFPRFNSVEPRVTSPPYMHQLTRGQLHGFSLAENQSGQPVVRAVEPGSAAEQNGLTAGVRIARLNGTETPTLEMAEQVLARAGPDVAIELADGQSIRWSIGDLPSRSRRVHPAQVYSAISGFLICFLLLSSEPYFNRSGAVLALFLTLYPVIRILEEMIRDDEPGQLGTGLTIAQIVSLCVLVGAAITWIMVFRSRPRVSEPLPSAG